MDGYYEEEDSTKVALEFQGCFWHGCPKCYARDARNNVNGFSMGELYEKTMDKKHMLQNQGFKYIEKWECEFRQELQENEELKDFVTSLNIVPPLEPRDAFFGGRTEAFTLYSQDNIKYYDVTSLYPFVNKTGKYVVGHPTKITENFTSLEAYEGLIKCKVLPPKDLLIPVLPAKINGKLLFALCKTCAERKQQTPCQHSDEERCFIGTWVSDDVTKALEKGYEIIELNEVWHFDQTSQYDPETKTGGLFTEYVNTFLKMKQEASGWPEWCVDEERKHKYIDDYYEHEGVQLDYDNIRKNPGLRSLAKLMLNSFWGKFGKRTNMQRLAHISDPAEFYDMMINDEQEVTGINFINDEIVELRWKYKEEFVEATRTHQCYHCCLYYSTSSFETVQLSRSVRKSCPICRHRLCDFQKWWPKFGAR